MDETKEESRKRRNREKAAAFYAANKEHCIAAAKARYEAKRDHCVAVKKAWAAANKDRNSAREAAWRAENKPRMASVNAVWRKANRAEILPKKAAYAAANKERIAATNKAWNEANKDRVAALNAAWRAANPERAAAQGAKWRAANPEQKRVLMENYRSRKIGAEGAYTATEVLTLFDQQHGLCAYCGVSIADGYHQDHIVPLTKGGSNWITNIALACQRCNLSKKNQMLDVWQRKMERLKCHDCGKGPDRPGIPSASAI